MRLHNPVLAHDGVSKALSKNSMTTSNNHSPVEVFSEQVLIRREDGTIASRISIEQLGLETAEAVADELAGKLDLTAQSRPRNGASRLGEKLPRPTVMISNRWRAGTALQCKTYLSFRLCIVSTGSGKNRHHRWGHAGLGEASQITQTAIEIAWGKIYGQWAWGSALRDRLGAVEIMKLELPEELGPYQAMIRIPPAPTVAELLSSIGYDPATGSDSKGRQRRLKQILSGTART